MFVEKKKKDFLNHRSRKREKESDTSLQHNSYYIRLVNEHDDTSMQEGHY